MISGSVDYSLKIWDLNSMRTIEDKKGHEGNVTCVSYYGNKFVSGSFDKSVRIWYDEQT